MKLPRAVSNLIDAFERLPGIGPKTAQRLAFYLVNVPEYEAKRLGDALAALQKGTVKCSRCFNIVENDPCAVCTDEGRERDILMVVEQAVDVLHFEQTGKYNGVYHVLHGRIDPLNNVSADDIYIPQLLERVDGLLKSLALNKGGDKGYLLEVILAVDSDMEGEATSLFVTKKLRSRLKARGSRLKTQNQKSKTENAIVHDSERDGQVVKITRLAHGLPVGASVEFADSVTLERALSGRREIHS